MLEFTSPNAFATTRVVFSVFGRRRGGLAFHQDEVLGFIVSIRLHGWTGIPRPCSPVPEAAASEFNSSLSTFCRSTVPLAVVVAVKTWPSSLAVSKRLQAPK